MENEPDEEPDHIQAHRNSIKNRPEIETSEQCGCFYCLTVVAPSAIEKWIDEIDAHQTAVCPHCGIDALIGTGSGYPITDEFLREMCEYWFENDPQRGSASRDEE